MHLIWFQGFVEVSQVGLPENDTYFIHTDPISNEDKEVRQEVSAALIYLLVSVPRPMWSSRAFSEIAELRIVNCKFAIHPKLYVIHTYYWLKTSVLPNFLFLN